MLTACASTVHHESFKVPSDVSLHTQFQGSLQMIEEYCGFLLCFQPCLNRSIQSCQCLVFLQFSWIWKAATIEYKASSVTAFITGNSRSSKSKRVKIKEHWSV